jgi:hypothetical protein
MNIVATTITTISATTIPNGSVSAAVLPPRTARLTAGAMSPDPLSTTEAPERRRPSLPSFG